MEGNGNANNGNAGDVCVTSMENGNSHAPKGHQVAPLPVAGSTTVVVNQMAVKPSSYLALAIIVCIFCNIVFGKFPLFFRVTIEN